MGLISKIQQLTSVSEEATEWLAKHLEEFSFRKNNIVLREGQICHYLYFINFGMAAAYTNSSEQEICNWISLEQEFATSYYSFLSRKASHETIICLESCEMEAISYSNLHHLFSLFPETERAGRLILEEYYIRLEERLISIQFKSAKERYQLLSEQRPEIIKRAPLGKVATYLGMKQETLSRIRSAK